MAGWRVGEEFVAVIQRIGINFEQNPSGWLAHFARCSVFPFSITDDTY